MDRLLDKEAVAEMGGFDLSQEPYKGMEDVWWALTEPILEAQRALTLKAVAEWGEVLCNSVHHDRFDARRSACHECTVGLFDMLGEGKAPWEAPQ